MLTMAMFPNLAMLMNTKPVLVKLTVILGHLVGDSILNGIGLKRLRMNNCTVEVMRFSVVRIRDVSQLVQTIIKKNPSF